MARKKHVRLTVRLDPERDADILTALARARVEGRVVNRIVVQALRLWMELEAQTAGHAAASVGMDAPAPAEATRIAEADPRFWDELRRVVEAAVISALGEQKATRGDDNDAERQQAEALLDALGGALEEW